MPAKKQRDLESAINKLNRSNRTKAAAPVDSQPEQPQPRHMGKSSDPNYKQLGVYIDKDILRKVKSKAALEDLELSQIVEDLLVDWLQSE